MMFTDEERELLVKLLQDELQRTNDRRTVQSALTKLLCIDDYSVFSPAGAGCWGLRRPSRLDKGTGRRDNAVRVPAPGRQEREAHLRKLWIE